MSFRKLMILRNKPAVYCAVFILSFFSGLISKGIIGCVVFASLFGVFSFVSLVLNRSARAYLRTVGIIFISATLGILLAVGAKFIYYYPSERFLEVYENKQCGMVLRVDKIDSAGDNYASYNCSMLQCDGKSYRGVMGIYPSVRLNSFGDDFIEKGDVIFINTVPQRPENKSGNGFDEVKYLMSRHIFIKCDLSGETKLIRKGQNGYFDIIRNRLSHHFTRYIGDFSNSDETVIAKCMLLGDKTEVSQQLKETFRCAGISHILSVSGLHLSILFMSASVIFGLYRRTARRRFVYAETVSCLLIFVYMALANFSPSIMRAGFMLIIMNVYSAVTFYKRRFSKTPIASTSDKDGALYSSDSYGCFSDTLDNHSDFGSVSALFFAGAIICFVSPYSVLDIGMQLSFMSTLGIIIAVSVMQGVLGRIKFFLLRFVVTSLFITCSAVAFTLPVCIYNFDCISTMSGISNLLVAPLMTPALVVLLLLALMSFLPQISLVAGVCSFLGAVAHTLCSLCIKVARATSGLWFSTVSSDENIFLLIIFIVFVIFTVGSMFLDNKQMKCIGFFAILSLYFTYMAVCVLGAVTDFMKPKVSACTVNGHPYFSVAIKNTRIVTDNLSGVASGSVMNDLLGDASYDTENIYLILPGDETGFEDTQFNIMCFNKSEGISAVLLPSVELYRKSGKDMSAYSAFVKNLCDDGYNVEFYSDEFTVENVKFVSDVSPELYSLSFDDMCVVFAEDYSDDYANNVSKDCGLCIYFCEKSKNITGDGYNSDAVLYVSSPHHNNIKGANRIPVRNPEIIDR